MLFFNTELCAGLPGPEHEVKQEVKQEGRHIS